MIADQENLIVDRYKGMEIRIRADLGEHDTWRCYIHICTGSHCNHKFVETTASVATFSLTRSAAMAMAFIEALGLCDAMLESALPVDPIASTVS